MLAQSNARLLRVSREGGEADSGYSDDYDRRATDPDADDDPGAELWHGSVAAYYTERRQRDLTGQTSRPSLLRSLVVDARHPEVDLKEDDTVTFTFEGTERVAIVQAVEERKLPGVSGTTRLTLEPATAN